MTAANSFSLILRRRTTEAALRSARLSSRETEHVQVFIRRLSLGLNQRGGWFIRHLSLILSDYFGFCDGGDVLALMNKT